LRRVDISASTMTTIGVVAAVTVACWTAAMILVGWCLGAVPCASAQPNAGAARPNLPR
jgi:hypothetical protein